MCRHRARLGLRETRVPNLSDRISILFQRAGQIFWTKVAEAVTLVGFLGFGLVGAWACMLAESSSDWC
jgi:hypothetical protein